MTILDPLYNAGIQKALNEKAGQNLTPDGQLGAKSIAAMKVFQQKNNLPQTGLYDDATSSLLDTFIRQKYITMTSINLAADSLTVTPAHIRTVCDVEAKGSGFLPDGRVQILFERHHFLAALQKNPKFAATLGTLKQQRSDIVNAQPGGYIGGAGEYKRFNDAFAIDPEAAIYATSFGLFQIMGFNYNFAGFSSLTSFFEAMKASEINQLNAFVSFNKKYMAGRLMFALKANDWPQYAGTYNGPNYKVNKYDTKLSDSFAKYTKNINAY